MSIRQSRSGNQCKSLLDSIPVHAEIDTFGNEAVPVLGKSLEEPADGSVRRLYKKAESASETPHRPQRNLLCREVRSHFVEMDSGVNVC
jgi:hypothetical protein